MANTCTVTMFGTRFINVEQPIEKPIEKEVKKPVVDNPEQTNNLAPNQEYSKDKLKKDGTPKIITHNKRKGVKSEAYDLSLADMNKLLTWLEQNEKWLVRFLCIISFNLARRKGDILSLTWAHFYDPKTGDFRKRLKDISEEKTDKLASPYINDVVKNAIKEYCEKVGCNPADNGFTPDLQNRQLAPVHQLSHCVPADTAGFCCFFDCHSHFDYVHNTVLLS